MCVCTIYEINETNDGQLYLVMARYEGETLKKRIARWSLELEEQAMKKPCRPGKGVSVLRVLIRAAKRKSEGLLLVIAFTACLIVAARITAFDVSKALTVLSRTV